MDKIPVKTIVAHSPECQCQPILISAAQSKSMLMDKPFSADLKEDEILDDTGIIRRVAAVPFAYISTDRADLLRILEHIDRIRKELESTPTISSKVTTAQWQALTRELYALLALSRRIKGRIDNVQP